MKYGRRGRGKDNHQSEGEGKPVIRGTRIPVDAIIKRLAQGMSTQEILEEYPNLKEEDVRAALD